MRSDERVNPIVKLIFELSTRSNDELDGGGSAKSERKA